MEERLEVVQPPKFDFTKPEEWPTWINRFELFRTASGLELETEEIQVNALIYTMGVEAEDVLMLLDLTEDQEANDYHTLKTRLDRHFQGSAAAAAGGGHVAVKRNVVFERYQFNIRYQEVGETADCFIAALHRLSEHCEYGARRGEMIRDRLVVGVADQRVSEELQMDPWLTLEKAVTRIRQRELVKKQHANYKLMLKK